MRAPVEVARFTFTSSSEYVVFSYTTNSEGGKANVTLDGIDYGRLDYYYFEGITSGVAILPVPARRLYHTLHITVDQGPVNEMIVKLIERR